MMYEDKKFKCSRCSKTFDTKARRNNHKARDHGLPHCSRPRKVEVQKK